MAVNTNMIYILFEGIMKITAHFQEKLKSTYTYYNKISQNVSIVIKNILMKNIHLKCNEDNFNIRIVHFGKYNGT